MRPHSVAYYVKTCKDCGQGQLVVTKNPIDNSFFIICDDCMSEWGDPETKNRLDNRYNLFGMRNATLEEIKELGWEKYITGNYVDFDCV
jgi:hypothetical protein